MYAANDTVAIGGWSGAVNRDASLDPGGAPPNFIFTETSSYPGFMQLQVSYTPEPTAPCDDDDCDCDADTGSLSDDASDETDDSVELATGRFRLDLSLLSAAALGAARWSFALSYYPGFGLDDIVGKNFNFPQSDHLNELATIGHGVAGTGANDIELIGSRNTREVFKYDYATGGYDSGGNNTSATLARSGSGAADQLTLTGSNGTISTFFGFNSAVATPGRLKSIVDRFGNTLSLAWGSVDGVPQLLSVTDGYGRTVQYGYYGPEYGSRVRLITDFLGRQLNFQYDGDGHLLAVVTPSILKAAPGNAFPGGTAYVFEYDVNNPRPDRRDDLIAVYYPNQTLPFLNVETRAVDVAAVCARATPRYRVGYGQDPTDANSYGKVTRETLGDPSSGVGGTSSFSYTTTGLPANLVDPSDPIVSRTTVADRNDNRINYDFNANWRLSRKEVQANRGKSSLQATAFVTWTQFNAEGRPLLIVYPAGNSVQYTYEDGTVAGLPSPYVARRGLLRVQSRSPGNPIGLPSRPGSNGQTVLTRRFFYEPLFNQVCAYIEERGNPIDVTSGAYFAPQNGGAVPTDADRSRYATTFTFDYQKDAAATVAGDPALQMRLGLSGAQIQALIDYVNNQMTAADGTGGLPAGFPMGLGDVNGEGTGAGAGADATHLGNVVKVEHPAVRQLIPTAPGAYARAVLSDAPAAYWRLNDPAGSATAADASGNGRAAAPSGAGVTLGLPGPVAAGAAAAFDGSGASIGVGAYSPVAGDSDFTLECWFDVSAFVEAVPGNWTNYLITKGSDVNPNSYGLALGDGDGTFATATVGLVCIAPGALYVAAPAPGSLTPGWHHVAGVRRGTTLTLYLDGLPVATAAFPGSIAADPSLPFTLGRQTRPAPYAYPFDGKLAEAAVYPRALSADRVLTHYQAAAAAAPWAWATQQRTELFTSNLRGQRTTRTDPEGNLTVYVRHTESDPYGDGQTVTASPGGKQYGMLRETHLDADPNTVMDLVGADGDLVNFVPGVVPRTNTPGTYLDLVTRNGGGSRGCVACSYDPLGNALSTTDARGFTASFDRNELGEVYRVTAPAPYNYRVETYYDANRNAVRVDTEDLVVAFQSADPTDPWFAQF